MILKSVLSPFRLIVIYYLTFILLATCLLYLPISQQSGVQLNWSEALFTATSAMTVTGLTVVHTADSFSVFGIIVIAFCIQLGGIGIMTMGTFIWMMMGSKISMSRRMLIMADHNQMSLSGIVYLIKNLLGIALLIELIGAIILGIYFLNYFDRWYEAFYQGTFAGISAFTNAGFDITGQSLVPFAGDYFVQVVVMLMIIAGAIGFPVLVELKEYFSGKDANFRFSLFTKITTTTYFILLVFSTVSIWLFERGQHYVGMEWHQQFFFSLFTSVTARSAGLTTMDMNDFTLPTLMFLSVMMIIGASPSSVGGGIRTTTLAVMFLTIRAFTLGRSDVKVFGRELHLDDIRKCFIVISLFIAIWFAAIIAIVTIEGATSEELISIVFEVSSAFGTCGLSMGITSDLSQMSQFILMILMFMGRIGLVALLFSLKKKDQKEHYHYPKERIIIG